MAKIVVLKDSGDDTIVPRASYNFSMSANETKTVTLTIGYGYLIVARRSNASDTSYNGLYIAQVHNSSSIRAIAAASMVTMSISGTTLTITTTQNYTNISIIPL